MTKMLRFTASSLILFSSISAALCADEKHNETGPKTEPLHTGSKADAGHEVPAHVPVNAGKKPFLEKVKENPTGFRDDIKPVTHDGQKGFHAGATQPAERKEHAGGTKEHVSREHAHPHGALINKPLPDKTPRIDILQDLKGNPHKYNDKLHKPTHFGTPKPSEDH